jgi:hypothetical protein
MSADSSPVYAPWAFELTFWPPINTFVPLSAIDTGTNDTDGGQTTVVTLLIPDTPFATARASAEASANVLFIFQLPATTGVRI